MINMRYKKLTGMHTGHSYVVVEPASEIDSPMRWMLHCESVADEKLIVSEDELSDPKSWQPLD
ncbi:MAG: hypothetical protein Q8L53_13180 [Aestuariivirga sp.]|nr:hypothetical protein [Aestuariivirga sp.]